MNNVRVWVFATLMSACVILAVLVPPFWAGLLFVLTAVWFAAMAGAEFARKDDEPDDK